MKQQQMLPVNTNHLCSLETLQELINESVILPLEAMGIVPVCLKIQLSWIF